MGIDMPDVAFVLHVTAPKTLEAYYQEAGRAGRDGCVAECALMYGGLDAARLAAWGFDALGAEGVGRARAVIAYAEARRGCRKATLLNALGSEEDLGACMVCDNCCRRTVAVDCSAVALSLVNAAAVEERMTLARLIKYVRGVEKMPAKVAALVAGGCVVGVPEMPVCRVASVVQELVARRVLRENFAQSAFTTNAYLEVAPEFAAVVGCADVENARLLGLEPVVLHFDAEDAP
ncbi:hypothetical protein LPJ66_011089 [Kickxella alabastrina]|uniref:Uncharacterized protein n=1 Tax=Kickxella alabastrina TaxID=61397 RepID=A0ACC1I069_9FUNG|nr:hypothetical protein LPJ66_011089 [Kickxella alabastrina]